MTALAGRRVLVTGAAGGLGPTVIAAAAGAGARLVLVDVAQERLDVLARDFPEAVESTHVVDLLDDDAAAGFAAQVTAAEPVDAVWHLVGGWRGGTPLQDQPLDDWEWLHSLLVRTTVHVARAFAEPLQASDQGRFAIISAKEAQAPTSKNAAYATAKAASEAVVLALANGFKGSTATANVVVVPAILTPAMRAKNPDKDWGAFVPAEQIADALVYLSSPAGAKMNGQRIRLYSGGPS
jgi:NAD(P)-dependent dehydrogenase (short-subunit alcohol dehydrogenase family)